jgi:hypothetical protein
VSVKDEKMNLMHSITVRVNGIVKVINRMEWDYYLFIFL